MSVRFLSLLCFSVCALLCANVLTPDATAGRAVAVTQWNQSPDPAAPYGGCSGGPADDNKLTQLTEAGVPLYDLLAVVVLSCKPFDRGGIAFKAPCPAGSPYQECVRNHNDGRGNSVYLGIVRQGAAADPNSKYEGCPAGSTPRAKIDLVIAARLDPRVINGIETLSCNAATGSGGVTQVPCPSGPSPFAYCLATPDDGAGNAVTVGVIGANGAGDPYALYGECGSPGQGIRPGFSDRMSFVAAANQNTQAVVAIDMLFCKINQGEPATPTATACGSITADLPPSNYYDYCIWGTDKFGNAFAAGVRTTH